MRSLLKSTFGLVAVVMAFFAAISAFVANRSSKLMVDEATKTVQGVVKNSTGQINRMMTGVETAVANQRWIIRENLADPDYMYRITDELVVNNEHIFGSTVAFPPNYYKSKGYFYSPYTCINTNGTLTHIQLGNDKYRYHEWEWYAKPKNSGKPEWSEPYYDDGGGKELMCTYSVPVYDQNSNFCAIVTADLTLKRLTERVASMCPYPDSFVVLRSAKGAMLVSPPSGRSLDTGDGKSIVISDIADNGWTVSIICPIDEILRGSHQMVFRFLCFSALGLAAIFMLSWFYSKQLQHSAAMRERMAGELNTARNIQNQLVPRDFPNNIWAVLRPAREVGGDVYDFVRKGNKLYFIIGDASGKGVPAALFSFIADTVFRMACNLQLNPGEICGRMNVALCRNNEMSMFVTAFVGALNLETGELEFGCAGHNAPIIITPDGRAEFLKVKRGPPTGAVSGVYYDLQSVKLAPGSKILAYTDGVNEAERADHSQYGDGRLLDFAAKNASADVHELVARLLKSVDGFVNGAEQSDDITVMAVEL